MLQTTIPILLLLATPPKNDNNNFFGGMWAYWINLLFFTMFGELVVVSYRVTLPVTDLFARNFWCVKGDLGSRLHLEGHTGPMEIRVPKQVTAIHCMQVLAVLVSYLF